MLHSQRDPLETTAKARATFLARFEREVDPDGVLPVEERLRRAYYARKAYFARIAYKSAKTRTAKRLAREKPWLPPQPDGEAAA